MKLYDYLKLAENDFDTEDTVYCTGVTVCYIEENESNDDYDKFCIELMKKAEVEKVGGDIILVKWTDLIKKNMDKFRAFTAENWHRQYKNDDDEFICQWINEIHYYMAGYVSEDFYKNLVKLVATLKA